MLLVFLIDRVSNEGDRCRFVIKMMTDDVIIDQSVTKASAAPFCGGFFLLLSGHFPGLDSHYFKAA